MLHQANARHFKWHATTCLSLCLSPHIGILYDNMAACMSAHSMSWSLGRPWTGSTTPSLPGSTGKLVVDNTSLFEAGTCTRPGGIMKVYSSQEDSATYTLSARTKSALLLSAIHWIMSCLNLPAHKHHDAVCFDVLAYDLDLWP